MGKERLRLALPSKGRLKEQTIEMFADGGITVRNAGSERGYRGEIVGMEDMVEVAFVSASEIAAQLQAGKAHLAVTGEDLVQERMSDWETRVGRLKPLGYGYADVVVAVPQCWVDVRRIEDLDAIAAAFRERHSRWFRVATKYVNLARRHFAEKHFADYRIVESLGATEGTPAAGAADFIVDITTTGATLKANGLKVLEDGPILKSQACLFASNKAEWKPEVREVQNELMERLGV